MREVDIAILGAGTAGLTAMGIIRHQTDDFVMINAGHYGTTCARVGCMPSKVLIQIAKDWHRRHEFETMGIRGAEHLSLDRKAVMKRVRELRDGFVKPVLRATNTLYEEQLISGRAVFKDVNTLEVNGETIKANKIIIATGSRPIIPKAWEAMGKKILTSNEIFELEELPKSIAVVGLGVIGLELGQALSRLGVDVVGIEMREQIGALTDPVVLEKAIELIGAEFPLHLGQAAELEDVEGGVKVRVGDKEFIVDAVLAALGRRPNVDGMGLEKLGVPLDERGVPHYNPDTLQVGDLPIFLLGDANTQRMAMHEASDDGRIAAYNVYHLDNPQAFRRRAPFSIGFTEPQMAIFGKRYADLEEGTFVIGEFNFKRQTRARIFGENRGIMRLYADKESKKLLGGEMIVPHAEHLVHLLAWALQRDLTVLETVRFPTYHPTVEEGMHDAIRNLSRQLYAIKDRFELRKMDE